MPSKSDPSKHHYLPEFYLRWWTGEDGRFERYTRPIPNKVMVRRVFPSEAGFVRNLYSSPGETRLEPHWLETRVFQRIDDRAARVMQKLNAEPPHNLSAEEVSAWSVFIRALLYRTPEGLRAIKESGSHQWRKATEEARGRYQELKGPNDPESFDEYVAGHSSSDIERSVLNVLPGIFTSERVGQVLNDLHYRIIDTPNSAPTFLISDDFLTRTNGIMVENGHFALPIAPRRLLVMAWKRDTHDVIARMTAKELVTTVNQWIAESARHFVGCVDRSQDRFIRNHFGVSPKEPISRSACGLRVCD